MLKTGQILAFRCCAVTVESGTAVHNQEWIFLPKIHLLFSVSSLARARVLEISPLPPKNQCRLRRLFVEWHSVYYAFEATRLRVTKYRTSTIDVNRTDIGSRRKHPFLPISHGDVSHETSPAAKSEEKRMFSQAMISGNIFQFGSSSQFPM